MPTVEIKGVGKAQFPDDMNVDSIRSFLRNKYSQRAMQGDSDILSPVESTASPYEPSLVDRIGGGIASGLTDAGLISDNYRAQQIGKNLSTIGEFLPGIGDATAGDDAGRAFAKGDYGEGLLHSAGTIPVLGDMAIFAGALAKNADLGMLSKAKLLEDTGADRNKIWKETGWVNDKGDWKFEIDDSEMKLNQKAFTDSVKPFTNEVQRKAFVDNEFVDEKGFVGDVVTPNYSDAGFTKMTIKDMGPNGSYNPESHSLDLSSKLKDDDLDSVALHEMQHFIQQQEGFASGGSPSALGSSDSFENYKHLAGEAEARNVQARMNMTPEQRRATPPWETLDVPENELIYRKQ